MRVKITEKAIAEPKSDMAFLVVQTDSVGGSPDVRRVKPKDVIDASFSDESEKPVQNKVIMAAMKEKADKIEVADLKSAIDNIGGSLSDRAIQLLGTILTAAAYTSDQSANIEALIEELSSGGNVDNITVADGVMTILGLADTPTFSSGVLSIT